MNRVYRPSTRAVNRVSVSRSSTRAVPRVSVSRSSTGAVPSVPAVAVPSAPVYEVLLSFTLVAGAVAPEESVGAKVESVGARDAATTAVTVHRADALRE